MKAKQKKRILSLVVLVVLLAAVVVGYVFVSKMDFEDDTSDASTSTIVSVVSADVNSISTLSYAAEGGEALTFIRENGVWYYEADRDFPVKQDLIHTMSTTASSVTASRELTDGDTGEYGFDKPTLSVSTTYTDGSAYSLTLGATNSFNSSVYLKDQAGKVYMFLDTLSEDFAYGLNDLIDLDDPAGDVDINYLVDVTLTDASGAQNVITDTDGMYDSMDSMDKLDCTDWVDYAMDDAAFAEYGIDGSSARFAVNYKSAVAVTDESGNTTTTRVPKTYEYIFGDHVTEPNDEGVETEYVYYTATGSTILYKTELAVYEEVMGWITYTAPETTEAESSDTSAETE